MTAAAPVYLLTGAGVPDRITCAIQDGYVPSGMNQGYLRYSKSMHRSIDVGDVPNPRESWVLGPRESTTNSPHLAHVTSSQTDALELAGSGCKIGTAYAARNMTAAMVSGQSALPSHR
jgi:hypothetical protein